MGLQPAATAFQTNHFVLHFKCLPGQHPFVVLCVGCAVLWRNHACHRLPDELSRRVGLQHRQACRVQVLQNPLRIGGEDCITDRAQHCLDTITLFKQGVGDLAQSAQRQRAHDHEHQKSQGQSDQRGQEGLVNQISLRPDDCDAPHHVASVEQGQASGHDRWGRRPAAFHQKLALGIKYLDQLILKRHRFA